MDHLGGHGVYLSSWASPSRALRISPTQATKQQGQEAAVLEQRWAQKDFFPFLDGLYRWSDPPHRPVSIAIRSTDLQFKENHTFCHANIAFQPCFVIPYVTAPAGYLYKPWVSWHHAHSIQINLLCLFLLAHHCPLPAGHPTRLRTLYAHENLSRTVVVGRGCRSRT